MKEKKNYWEVEAIIEERIAKESEEWDLDRFDIESIRLEAYQEKDGATIRSPTRKKRMRRKITAAIASSETECATTPRSLG